MINPESQSTLGTRHRTNANKENNTTQTSKMMNNEAPPKPGG